MRRNKNKNNNKKEEQIKKVIEEYNRFHGVEAVAKVLKIEGNSVEVEITGPFCISCAPEEYVTDLQLEFQEQLARNAKVSKIIQKENGFQVTFSLE